MFGGDKDDYEEFFDELPDDIQKLIKLKETFDLTTELAEFGKPTKVTDEDGAGSGTLKIYKQYIDGKLKLDLGYLKNLKSRLDAVAGDERRNFDDRDDAALSSFNLQTEIIKKEQALKNKLAEQTKDNDLAKLPGDKSSPEAKLAEENDIIQRFEDAKVLIQQDANKKTLDNAQVFFDKKIKLTSEEEGLDTSVIAIENNKKIAAIKKRINEEGIVGDERKELLVEIADLEIDTTNKILEAKIILLKAEIALAKSEGNTDRVAKLTLQLSELEKAIKLFQDATNDFWADMSDEDKFLLILDAASKLNDALSDLSNAIFDRKIENINAEINAEKDKYDKLIALAENDEEKQAVLERNKNLRIKRLEKERLEQEQKSAKIQKAFAVADIAIKLAQTLVANNLAAASINAATLGTGGTIWLAIQNPLAIAVAAIQTAAVLASPIPQFAKGGVMDKDGLALINDGGSQEYVERNGQMLTNTNKDSLVNLQGGDIIHKDYETMIKMKPIFEKYLHETSC
jgi:hypothetical protein